MGLFDFFKRKPQVDPEDSLDLDAGFGPGPLESFIRELGSRYEGAKVVDRDEDELELRARVDDVPVRLVLTKNRGQVKIEAMLENRIGTIDLTRDETRPPISPDAGDAWSDEDEVRIFLGHGIFVEGRHKGVKRQQETFAKLPSEFQDRLLSQMHALRVWNLATYRDRLFLRTEEIGVLPSALDTVQAAIGLACECAREFSSGDGPLVEDNRLVITSAQALAEHVQQLSRKHVKCAFCSTEFVLEGNPVCPNCSAAYAGED
jgi:hypothetical protein